MAETVASAAAAAAENEADSGGAAAASSTPPDGGGDDDDHVTAAAAASNYDSSDGGALHRCKRCDFEGVSRAALTSHTAQAHAAPTVAATTTTASSAKNENSDNNNSPPAANDRVHRKMFECDVCNMKFSNGANMRRHKMRHTGVKPYECRVCQKRFFRKDHLAEHFTTHTKTLPYHCPICNRGFQRQIAMRAHFQNEHVGQHDLVKSCPLCSYRAGSMKSLRVHFFNRHGIDLDNPGPAGSQASLFAAAAAAAQQGFSMDGGGAAALTSLGSLAGGSVSVSVTGGGSGGGGSSANYSDSGDSTGARSTDNATPPMHFLTPHVEISMADAFSPSLNDQNVPSLQTIIDNQQQRINGLADCPGSPHSADSNSNAPSSSHNIQSSSGLRIDQETNITPSISLIPIKQEPGDDLYDLPSSKRNGSNPSTSPSSQIQAATSSSLSSLIKVSPLKSLLRDDLKRKIVSRMTSSPRGRSSTSSPNQVNSEQNCMNDSASTTTTNGAVITSTGTEQSDSALWRAMGKRLQCVFCGIAFPDQTLYFLHKGCHSDANPWKCNICGEQCCNVYEFNSHLLSKSHQ